SVYCSPAAGLQYPALRLEDEVYDEDGNTLQDFAYDHEPLGIANPSSMIGEMYTLYYPPEKSRPRRWGLVDAPTTGAEIPGQRGAGLVRRGGVEVGKKGPRGTWGDAALRSPAGRDGHRHRPGSRTPRYRKQMAVKKYLAAVLGKRYKQRVKNKGRRVAYL
ncbi:Glucagon family neuropeptide protein, partial [Chaetura pelagica]